VRGDQPQYTAGIDPDPDSDPDTDGNQEHTVSESESTDIYRLAFLTPSSSRAMIILQILVEPSTML
jgi:hypothetical protein